MYFIVPFRQSNCTARGSPVANLSLRIVWHISKAPEKKSYFWKMDLLSRKEPQSSSSRKAQCSLTKEGPCRLDRVPHLCHPSGLGLMILTCSFFCPLLSAVGCLVRSTTPASQDLMKHLCLQIIICSTFLILSCYQFHLPLRMCYSSFCFVL